MDSNTLALIATACGAALLGIAALWRAPDRPSNRLFAFHVLWATSWTGLTCWVMATDDLQLITKLMRVMHFISTLMVASLIDFIWVFPDRLRPQPTVRRAMLYASGVVLGLVASLPQLIVKIEMTTTGPNITFGWPLAAMAFYVVPLIGYANWLMVRRLPSLRGTARVQTIYLFIGSLVSEVFIIITNVVLPLITGNTAYSRWGAVGYFSTIAAIGVAITKHHLWDLSGMSRRVAAALLASASIVPLGSLAVWVLGWHLGLLHAPPVRTVGVWVAVGAVLGLLVVPIYSGLRGLLSRAMREERDRIGELMAELAEAIVHAPCLQEQVLTPILRETQRFFGASWVRAYVRHPDGIFGDAGVAAAEGEQDPTDCLQRRGALPPSLAIDLGADTLAEPLEVGQLLRFGAIATAARKLAALRALGADAAVPMRWDEKTIGLLVLGTKLSGDMYTRFDFVLLQSVAAYAAIALKNAELRSQIIAEKEQTEKVLAQMESGVVAVDGTGTVCLVNPAACVLLSLCGSHVTAEDLLGKTAAVLPAALREPLERALRERETVSGMRMHLDPQRRLRVACSTFVLEGQAGSTEGAGVVFRDLATEDALYWVERETERLRFIRAVSAGIAHEIRNPLVAIRTFAELAPTRLDDPEFRESFLRVAQSEVARLENLVSQFMHLSKPVFPVRELVDLEELARNTVTAASARAEEQGCRLAVKVAPGTPTLRGDASRLSQALTNLLANALDATPPNGEIEVTVDTDERETGEATEVRITVWNSGSYIPPELQERVFEPFFTSKGSGVGLGLAICHTIAREHGGTISVDSSPDEGTAFTLRLPLVTAHDMTPLRPA